MKNIYEVIQQKEQQLQQIQRELEALRIAASLLNEGSDAGNGVAAQAAGLRGPQPVVPVAMAEAQKRWP